MSFDNDILDLTDEKLGQVKYRSVIVLFLIGLNFLCFLLAFYFSLVEIESIMISGGVLLVLSFTLLVFALLQRKYFLLPQVILGVSSIIVVFLFIFLKELSPSEAKRPVPWLILFSSVIYLIPLSISIYKEFRLPKKVKEN